jgi:hypothetical protein
VSGAESLVGTLIAGGIDVCFANPGTSEMHIVTAMSTTPGIRPAIVAASGSAPLAAIERENPRLFAESLALNLTGRMDRPEEVARANWQVTIIQRLPRVGSKRGAA